MAKKITLQITNPDGSVSESVSEQESIIVGSGAGAAVKVKDPKVSNLHCMIKVEKDGTLSVIDLGSEGGTRVREQLVKDPTALGSGDTATARGGGAATAAAGATGTAPLAGRAAPLPRGIPTAPESRCHSRYARSDAAMLASSALGSALMAD